jgi:hypothetical protein
MNGIRIILASNVRENKSMSINYSSKWIIRANENRANVI